MQNDKNTELLRSKIEGLDTLSGGIVYGKEEAWEKLQQRMDRKPAKKIMLRYFVAAAAVLLLLVSIVMGYYHPSLSLRNNNSVAIISVPVNNAVVGPQVSQPLAQQGEVVSRKPASANSKKSQTGNVVAGNSQIIEEYVDQTSVPNERKAEELVTAPTLTPPVKAQMRVVNINDLEAAQDKVKVVTEYNKTAVVDFKTMPVVHITDVVNEEYEIKVLRRENRFSFGRQLFPKPVYNEYPNSVTEENPQPRHLLKNILNAQN